MTTARLILKTIAGIVMVAIMAVTVRACIAVSERSEQRRALRAVPEADPILPSIGGVTPEQLKADYDENEVAAEAKYKGRTLEVTAVVSSIDKNFADQIVLRLRLGKHSEMSAFLDKRDAALAAVLKRGNDVSLLCLAGMRVLGKPTLRECRIRS